MSGFSALDWAVVVLYMGGIAAFGLAKGGKQASAKDYFLSEKKIGWWAVTASIVATETSALTFISVPGMAWKGAWGFLELSFGYLIGRIVIAWVLLPRYFEGELTTSYALLERTFGVGVRRLASATFILTRVFADGVRLYATAIPLVIIFRGYNLFSGVGDPTLYVAAIILTAAVTVVYVQIGGVRAVIWTDVIQLGVYILGGFIAIAVLVPKIPNLAARLAEAAAAGKLTVFQTGGDFLTSPYHVLTAILGGAVLSMASHGTDYIIVQRLFATESLRDGRRALVASGVVVILQFVLFLVRRDAPLPLLRRAASQRRRRLPEVHRRAGPVRPLGAHHRGAPRGGDVDDLGLDQLHLQLDGLRPLGLDEARDGGERGARSCGSRAASASAGRSSSRAPRSSSSVPGRPSSSWR